MKDNENIIQLDTNSRNILAQVKINNKARKWIVYAHYLKQNVRFLVRKEHNIFQLFNIARIGVIWLMNATITSYDESYCTLNGKLENSIVNILKTNK